MISVKSWPILILIFKNLLQATLSFKTSHIQNPIFVFLCRQGQRLTQFVASGKQW